MGKSGWECFRNRGRERASLYLSLSMKPGPGLQVAPQSPTNFSLHVGLVNACLEALRALQITTSMAKV